MDVLLSDPKFSAVVGTGLVIVLWWLWRGHSKRLADLELDAARKADLQQLRNDHKADLDELREDHRADMDQMRAEAAARHRESSEKLNLISAGVNRTHERIDALILKKLESSGSGK